MRGSGKNRKRVEQVPKGKRKPARLEPLHPAAEQTDKLYNDLAKFPEENPYPVLRIQRDGTVLYANKAGEPLLKAEGSGIGQMAPVEWRRLIEKILASGCTENVEVKDDGRIFLLQAVPIAESNYVNFYGMDITERKRAEEAIQISETRFRELFNNMSSGVAVYEAIDNGGDFIFRDFNPAAEKIEKVSREDILGKRVTEVFPGVKTFGVFEVFQRVWQTGKPEYFPQNIYSDERILESWRESWVLKLPTGEIVAIYNDITERKRAEERVKAERQRLYDVLETLPVMVCLLTPDYHVAFTNRVFRQKFGEDNGRYCYDYIFGRKGPCEFCEAHNVLKTGKPHHWECTGPDGCSIIDVYDFPFTDTDGTPLILEMDIDITERKQAEQALRASEERFRLVIENAPFGYYRVGKNGLWQHVNPAWERMHGYSLKDVIGKSFEITQTREDVEKARQYVNRALAGETITGEFSRITRQGKVEYHIFNIQPVRQGNEIVAIEGFINDITERKQAEEALRTSEERLKTAIDAAKLGIWDWDLISGKVTWMGHSKRMFGFEKGQFDNRYETLVKMIHPDDQAIRTAAIEKSKSERTEYSHEYRIIRTDGTVRWIMGKGQFVYDEAGTAVRMFGVMQDITERKHMEAELRKERDFDKSLVEMAQAIVLVLDTRGRIVSFNPYMEEISGYKLEEVLGFDWFSTFVPKRDRERIRELFKKAATDIQTHGNVNSIVTKKGEEREIEWYDKTLKDNNGNIVGLLSIGQDVTERKKADDTLRTSESKLSNAMKIAKLGYWEYDAVKDLFIFNDQFYSIFRTTAERVGGYTMSSARYAELFLPPEDRDVVGIEIKKAIETTDPNYSSQLEHRIIYADGETGHITVRFSIIKDHQGRTVRTYGANQDITEHRTAEGKLLEYQKQLKKLTSELALTEERERRRIAGELHDEVSQSLALAKINLDSLLNSAASSAIAGDLKGVSGEIEKAIRTTRSLTFDLSNPILYELGFEAAVSEWLNEQLQDKRGIHVEYQDDGKPKPLDEDVRAILFRNVRELLINVIKHSKADKVRVSISRIDNTMQVIVEDNGVGFDTSETSLAPVKKAKFGLFSIRENLEQLGGSFQIESKPGAGCTATMIVPLKRKGIDDERNKATHQGNGN